MKLILRTVLAFSILAFFSGCETEEFELGEAPTQQDAEFTFATTSEGPNYIMFTNNSDAFLKKWDFGNGSSAEGDEVTAYFPFAGEYTVTLTAYFEGGSVESFQEVVISQTDPEICNVEVLQLLTGGCDATEGKTWVIDAERGGHFGLGPVTSFGPDWYQAVANEKVGGGLYNDEFTFILNESVFIQETNGDVYLNGGQTSNFPGAVESEAGDFIAPYTAPADMNYSISRDAEDNIFINLSNGGFIGYATGVSSYQIMSISENEMFLRFKDAANAEFAWYHRLIPKGFEPISADFSFATSGLEVTFTNNSLNATTYSWDFGDGATSTEMNPVHTYAAAGTYDVVLEVSGNGQTESITQSVTVIAEQVAFPLTFETVQPAITVFGGSTAEYVVNPDQNGINTSNNVMQTVKGFEPWAGLFFDLSEPLDFTESTTITLKVWAPATGTFRFKLENIDNNQDFIEIDQPVNVANEWTQLSFDVSGAPSGSYARIVLFPSWNVANGGTFYIDDVDFATCDSGERLDPAGGNINFTFDTQGFGQFGNIVSAIVDNPDPGGINTSCNVNIYEKTGGCETWSGVAYEFDNPIDFGSANGKVFKMKVYAVNQTAEVKLRLERLPFPDAEPAIERTATISNTGQWEELTFDFSDATDPNTYKVMVIYFEQGATCDGDVYYFDDIVQQ